jgi:hypothetical protein
MMLVDDAIALVQTLSCALHACNMTEYCHCAGKQATEVQSTRIALKIAQQKLRLW